MPVSVNHKSPPGLGDAHADWSGVVVVPNATGGTTTNQASNLLRPSEWEANHATTIAVTGSEVASLFSFANGLTGTTGAGGVTAGLQNYSYYEPFPLVNLGSSVDGSAGLGTWRLSPFVLSHGVGPGRFNFFVTRGSGNFLNGVSFPLTQSGSFSATADERLRLAVYSQGAGTNVTRLESVWTGECVLIATRSMIATTNVFGSALTVSNYLTVGMVSQIDTAGNTTSTGITASGAVTSSTSMAASSPDSLISAARNWYTGSVMQVAPFTTSIAAGPYWMGLMAISSSGGAATDGIDFSTAQTYFRADGNGYLAQGPPSLSAFKRLGLTTVANSSSQWIPFFGDLRTSTDHATSAIATSDIVLPGNPVRTYWNYVQDTK